MSMYSRKIRTDGHRASGNKKLFKRLPEATSLLKTSYSNPPLGEVYFFDFVEKTDIYVVSVSEGRWGALDQFTDIVDNLADKVWDASRSV